MSLPWSSKGVKATPVNADELLILDSADANPATVNKRITIGSLPVGSISPLTTKGDVYTFDTADQRLPVGTNGQILSADSVEATGLKWIAASSTGLTSINADTTPAQIMAAGTGLNIVDGGPNHTYSIDSTVVTLTGVQTLTNKTLTLPVISDFTNSVHDHSNTVGGGQLTNSALLSGVFSSITGLGTQSQNLDMGTFNINNLANLTLTGVINFFDGIRQTFNPNAANSGLNVGIQASPDPTSPVDGDIYYNSTTDKFRAREGGAWLDMISSTTSFIGFTADNTLDMGTFAVLFSADTTTPPLNSEKWIANEFGVFWYNSDNQHDFAISGTSEFTIKAGEFDAKDNEMKNVRSYQFSGNTTLPSSFLKYIQYSNSATTMFINVDTAQDISLTFGAVPEYTFDQTQADFNNNAIINVGTLNTNTIPGGTSTFAMLELAQTFTAKQTFTPSATVAGLNVGAKVDPDPTIPVNGDIYYNSTNNKFRVYENSLWVDMIGGGGSQTPWLSNIAAATFNLSNFGVLDFDSPATSAPGVSNTISMQPGTFTQDMEFRVSQNNGIFKFYVGVNATPEFELKNNALDLHGNVLINPGNVLDSNNNELLTWDEVASAVNYFTIENATTGNAPVFRAGEFGDSTMGLEFQARGTGNILFTNQGGQETLDLIHPGGSVVNYLTITSSITTQGPILGVAGTDADIDLNIDTKGTGVINAGNNLIKAVTDPVDGSDAATKTYVDNLVNGLSWKNPAVVATTGNITLSGNQTIDGVLTVDGDRVLVKDQTSGQFNGVYNSDTGAWTRTTDTDSESDLLNMSIYITAGSTQADTAWVLTTDPPIVVDTTVLTYVQVGAGTGNPLTTKGDIFGYDTGNARIPVGTDGQVLTANSAVALGVDYQSKEFLGPWTANHDAGSFSLINLGGLTIDNGIRITFNPDATNAGLNVGSQGDPDPTSPVNGDIYYNSTNNKFRIYENSSWIDMIGAGSGDVVGPAGATDNAIPKYDGATGKLIQNTSVLIDDDNRINIPGAIIFTASGVVAPGTSSYIREDSDDMDINVAGGNSIKLQFGGGGLDYVFTSGSVDFSNNVINNANFAGVLTSANVNVASGLGAGITYGNGIKQTFNPSSSNAGINFGQEALGGDPAAPVNGDVYYNSTSNKFRAYENSTWVDMVGGGSGDVVGPASAVNHNVAVFDGATGKLIDGAGSSGFEIIIDVAGQPTYPRNNIFTSFAVAPPAGTTGYIGNYSNVMTVNGNLGVNLLVANAQKLNVTATTVILQDLNLLIGESYFQLESISSPASSGSATIGRLFMDADNSEHLTIQRNGVEVDLEAGGSGDVVGPGSSTDNAIAIYDGVTGKLIQQSGSGAQPILINDNAEMSGIRNTQFQLFNTTPAAGVEFIQAANSNLQYNARTGFGHSFTINGTVELIITNTALNYNRNDADQLGAVIFNTSGPITGGLATDPYLQWETGLTPDALRLNVPSATEFLISVNDVEEYTFSSSTFNGNGNILQNFTQATLQSSAGAIAILENTQSSPAPGTTTGNLRFVGDRVAASAFDYGRIEVLMGDTSSGSADGEMQLMVGENNIENVEYVTLNEGNTQTVHFKKNVQDFAMDPTTGSAQINGLEGLVFTDDATILGGSNNFIQKHTDNMIYNVETGDGHLFTINGTTEFSMSSTTLDVNGNDVDNIQNLIHDISTSGTDIDFNEDEIQTISISANTVFTTANRAAGKSKVLKITTDGTLRTLTFPGWDWTSTIPADQAATKNGYLTLTCFSTTDASIVASYLVGSL